MSIYSGTYDHERGEFFPDFPYESSTKACSVAGCNGDASRHSAELRCPPHEVSDLREAIADYAGRGDWTEAASIADDLANFLIKEREDGWTE